MAHLQLTKEEEDRINQIVRSLTAGSTEAMKPIRGRLSDVEWEQAQTFIQNALRLRIEGRLAIKTLLDRAVALGLGPSGFEDQFVAEADIQTWLLCDDPFAVEQTLDLFDVPSRTREEQDRVMAWLAVHKPDWKTRQDHDEAERACGLNEKPGSNIFQDTVIDLEQQAEALFFGEVAITPT